MSSKSIEQVQLATVDAHSRLLESLISKVSLCLENSADSVPRGLASSSNDQRVRFGQVLKPGLSVIEDPEEFVLNAQRRDRSINAVTQFLPARAGADIKFADLLKSSDNSCHPLCGVPYVVKDLFDVKGYTTTAGAKMRLDFPVAAADATVIDRLHTVGAVLVGTTNMDEFAYGFATDNHHFGVTRNPHDLERIAGGSSGGSAAAVAAGLVPFALGSDTNGSIRIPAALCGIYGLRASHGSVPVDGAFPFVDELDVVGPLAASLDVLRSVYNCISGSTVPTGNSARLRVATLDGLFAQTADPDFLGTLDTIRSSLGSCSAIEIPLLEEARAAAFVLTAIKGSFIHRKALACRSLDFDPAVRDRLIAGSLLSAHCLLEVEKFKIKFNTIMNTIWQEVDILIAPSAPCVAPRITQKDIMVNGTPVPARSHLGIFTQPFGLLGCPVLAAPIYRPGRLPLGLQFITARGRENDLFDLAGQLEELGITGVHPPKA